MQCEATRTEQRSKAYDKGAKEYGQKHSKEQSQYHQCEGDVAKVSGTLVVAFLCGLVRLQSEQFIKLNSSQTGARLTGWPLLRNFFFFFFVGGAGMLD